MIEVNLEKTELSGIFDQVFLGKGGQVMPSILEEIIKAKAGGN